MTERDEHAAKRDPEPGAGGVAPRAGAGPIAEPVTGGDGMRRREFLSVLGASFAALGLSGCHFRSPEEKVIPYLDQPEEITPGVAAWYASTCGTCPAACGILVKNRDGRPIKIEGNPDHPLTRGGLCARGQASVLDLYDSERLRGPLAGGKPADWERVDREVVEKLGRIREEGGAIRILGSTRVSSAAKEAMQRFGRAFPKTRQVTYDPISRSAILEAAEITHGERRMPWYRFDRAKVIVSFDADFLGTWVSPVEFARDWSLNRKPEGDRDVASWHAQIEARMSLTGASADLRVPLRPSRHLPALLRVLRGVAGIVRPEPAPRIPDPGDRLGASEEALDRIARKLAEAAGRSLVISGSNDVVTQVAVNFANHLLGNYGNTLDLTHPSLQWGGIDGEMDELIDEMKRGEVAALIIYDANPVHDHVRGREFGEALSQVGMSVSLAGRNDETAAHCSYVCPDHHPLESWGDAHPHPGLYSLVQPAIAPLFGTRAATESLLGWAGAPASAHELVRAVWKGRVFPLQSRYGDFEEFWTVSLHDGVAIVDEEALPDLPFREASVSEIAPPPDAAPGRGFEIVLYPSVAIGDGRQANNPWLQELPDPITKATWGNYASISPAAARALDVVEGRVVAIEGGPVAVRLPVQVQPGMANGVVAVALGYGRVRAGKIAANYPIRKMLPIEEERLGGADLYPYLRTSHVDLRPTGEMDPLAKTQTFDHQTVPLTGTKRPLVREVHPGESIAGHGEAEGGHGGKGLWPGHEYEGHKWSMVIDLNACTGCSACVVACQAENNVPVVGKAEVRKSRDMHWIRIDRYYDGSEEEVGERTGVSFQPMLCHHCDNAPCETVCPVLATVHSSEGLNMQVYNRCVGTRYCANNCPYKVRRFNWFDYSRDDPVQDLALNPDVTVRSRGIMEKCSFCIQRISEAKRRAKSEGRRLRDGEILPACMQSCPTEAIRFGDANDPRSGVAKARKQGRTYAILGETGVGPAVHYQARIRREEAEGS